VGPPPCPVKVHAEQDKACDISDNTSISQHESEAGSGSVQESNMRSRSPFHISSTSSWSESSKQSVKSCSWERAEATNPLLVRWRECKLLKTRINRIERLKF
jgi:hypothetical protein